MKKNKFTKAERLAIYKLALTYFITPISERPDGWQGSIGMCDWLAKRNNRCGDDFGIITDFPEYVAKKPTDREFNEFQYWFSDNNDRIKALEKCIKECSPKNRKFKNKNYLCTMHTCYIRPDLHRYLIPIGNQGNFIPKALAKETFEYRWREDDTIFEIKFNGEWLTAESIDFEFNN